MKTTKSPKERVQEKFDLASDIKESKITTKIYRVESVDGKITADFEINGLPVDKAEKESGMAYESSHKTIPKIFNNFDEFSKYAKAFFSKSDDEIKKLAKS